MRGMGRLRQIQKRVRRLPAQLRDGAVGQRLNVHRDPETGFLYQSLYGHRIFLRRRSEYLSAQMCDWLCRDIYFKYYQPVDGDTVVDVGAGLGHEAFYALQHAPRLRYVGVEVQPSIYEPLANSFAPVRDRCQAVAFAIADDDRLMLGSTENYTEALTDREGYMEVPTIGWAAFRERYGLGRIDLLKVNIEGGERQLFPTIGDMSDIRRVIVSAHDFRADRGDGERFRTRDFVHDYLTRAGYAIRPVAEDNWLRNWLYAERT